MLTYLLFAVLTLVAIGLVLLLPALMSGLWARLGARSHREQARDIERILAEDDRRARS